MTREYEKNGVWVREIRRSGTRKTARGTRNSASGYERIGVGYEKNGAYCDGIVTEGARCTLSDTLFTFMDKTSTF